MLTHEKLVELYRELRDERVLSIYLDGDQHDPAERNKWRKQLESMVSERHRALAEEPQEERQAFEEALSRLEENLRSYDAFIPSRGWVGFATADQVWYAEEVPVPMPDLVRWEPGIRVAPYVRGLKQERPVVLVLADSQKARLFEYRDGRVREVTDLRADTFLGDLSDVGVRKRSVNNTGVRGETSTDQAQRILEVSSERMLKELVKVVVERVGDHGFLVIGGTPETVKHASDAVPRSMGERVLERPSLYLGMSDAEVKSAAEEAASELTQRRQEEILASVIDQARSGGRACLGRDDVERALREMRVETLLLSRGFIQDDPDFADHCVGAAFVQDAGVEELGGAGAARLDEEGGGIGARLRFRIRHDGAGESGESAA
ncbi:MAG: hypothetical protein PVI57_13040 [Gemmatimonadota bacterium]|jgi:hypothetical protein